MAQPLSFTVSDHETTGTYLNKVTTYLIRTDPHRFLVRRRFSDFEWLYKTLANRYFGMLLPALPPKSVVKTQGFNKSRMRGLSLFMDHLRMQPFLRSDASVLAFISVTDPAEWDAAKKQTMTGQNRSAGEAKWREVLAGFQPPENAERCIMDVKRQLDPVDKMLNRLIVSAKSLADKSRAMAEEMQATKEAMMAWQQHEEACGDTSRVEYPNKDWASFQQVLGHSTALTGTWQEIMAFQPDINELVLYQNLKYQLAMVTALRDLIKQREQMMQTHQKVNHAHPSRPPSRSHSFLCLDD
jgi:hypothetical protein